jgi:hypothetical protein
MFFEKFFCIKISIKPFTIMVFPAELFTIMMIPV